MRNARATASTRFEQRPQPPNRLHHNGRALAIAGPRARVACGTDTTVPFLQHRPATPRTPADTASDRRRALPHELCGTHAPRPAHQRNRSANPREARYQPISFAAGLPLTQPQRLQKSGLTRRNPPRGRRRVTRHSGGRAAGSNAAQHGFMRSPTWRRRLARARRYEQRNTGAVLAVPTRTSPSVGRTAQRPVSLKPRDRLRRRPLASTTHPPRQSGLHETFDPGYSFFSVSVRAPRCLLPRGAPINSLVRSSKLAGRRARHCR